MEITAKALYDTLKMAYPGTETTLCLLHKPCVKTRRCAVVSCKEILDFDAIERRFHAHAANPLPSVDAVACATEKNLFCFVEIKGWNEFLYNPHRPVAVSEGEIEQQVRKYDLKGKLENSMAICLAVNQMPDFGSIKVRYIVVTDINVQTNPLESLAANLGMLATTSTRWEDLCNKYLKQKLEEVADIEKRYIHCKEFDAVMSC